MDTIVAGGISGGLDPNSDEAMEHTLLYYEEIRHFSSDCEHIAKNTGFSLEQILMVKNFLFIDEHNIYGGVRRFDPTFQIAESWRRLAFEKENIQTHDITLINHELLEMSYINQGYSQQEAHNLANEQYNYTEESDAFYEKQGFDLSKYKPTISGGITLGYNTH